jgi:hypothetical protein
MRAPAVVAHNKAGLLLFTEIAAGSGQLFANETYWSDVRQARLISVRLEFSLFQLRSLFQPSTDH